MGTRYGTYCSSIASYLEQFPNFSEVLLVLYKTLLKDAKEEGIEVLPGPPQRTQNPSKTITVFCWPAIFP